MRGRPDYGKESPDYAVGFIDHLSYLTDEEIGWLTHPRDGLHTVCKYLPTPADVAEFLKAKRDAANVSFRLPPPQGAHAYFEPEKETSQEAKQAEQKRRAEHVAKTLGYNPSRPKERIRPPLTEATEEDLKALVLKTPAAPATPQLRALLASQGWFGPTDFPPTQKEQAA